MLNYIKRFVIGSNIESVKKNFIWNMLGSGIYAITSMILVIAVVRSIGEEKGGVFAIALTLSQMLIYIAYFEMRTFQVTDVKNEYKFKDYYTAKLFTCTAMLVISLVYILLKGYSNEKAIIIFLMCIYKMIDGYADAFEADFQKIGRLDLAGKSLCFRTIFSTTVFIVAIFFSKHTILSLIIAIIVAIIGVYIFNILIIKDFDKIEITKDFRIIINVLKSCFPLFAGVFLWTYILSASRIAIDANMPSEYQTYYTALFMPVSIINLFCTFVFRPILTTLSESYGNNEMGSFRNSIMKSITIMIGFTSFCMAGAYFIGIPILSWLYDCNLSPYRFELVFLMMSGGLNALSVIMYYILTIMRRRKSILAGYVFAAALAMVISSPLVKLYGILGAAWSYFIVTLFLCLLFLVFLFQNNRRAMDM